MNLYIVERSSIAWPHCDVDTMIVSASDEDDAIRIAGIYLVDRKDIPISATPTVTELTLSTERKVVWPDKRY